MKSDIMPHWDNLSVLFYLLLAYIGSFCLVRGVRKSTALPIDISAKHGGTVKFNLYFLSWLIVWSLVSSLRLINGNSLGGTDAWSYIHYFEGCNNGQLSEIIVQYSAHYEILWKYVTKAIRLLSGNYKFYLLIYHAFLILSYQYFVKAFPIDQYFFAPFILVFFVFLRGFNTFRTNASAALILLMIVCLYRGKTIKACILGICAVGFQISSAMYCLMIPFYILNKKKKLKPWLVCLFLVGFIVIGKIAQTLLVGPLGKMLGHSYASYASRNIGHSFFENYWKISFGQLLLAVVLFLYDKKIRKRIRVGDNTGKSLQVIRIACIYDILTIPICFIISNWRGYENLYLARLIMWSELIYLWLKKTSPVVKKIIEIILVIGFSMWLVFRIEATWEGSGYLPYVLDIL